METTSTKICCKCLSLKPLDAFGIDRHTTDGHATRCILCKRQASARYRAEHPEKTRAATARWTATHPEERAAYEAAHVKEKQVRTRRRYVAKRAHILAQQAGYYTDHKEQLRPTRQAGEMANKAHRAAKRLETFLKDPEGHATKKRQREKVWRDANPEKTQNKNAKRRAAKAHAPVNDLTQAQWLEIQTAQQHRCYYCGTRCKGKLTQDHITPLSQGGSHTLHNVIGACLSCNSKKHAGPPLSPVQPLLLTLAPSKKPRTKTSA